MRMKARKRILFGVVVLLISGSAWGFQVIAQTIGALLGSPEPQNQERNDAHMAETLCYITLFKWTETPDTYVNLTKEEVATFPALQAALQTFEGSERTEVWYKTTEKEAHNAYNSLSDKYQESCDGSCSWNQLFEYQGEFYLFGIVVSAAGETTSEAPQTTTVSEELSALGVLVLLGTGIGIFFAQRPKIGKHRP